MRQRVEWCLSIKAAISCVTLFRRAMVWLMVRIACDA
jgi:hypothetical protein